MANPERFHLTGTPADILQAMTNQHRELVNLLTALRSIRHHRAIEEYQAAVLYHLAKPYDRQGAVALEIGTAKGYSASVIAAALPSASFLTLNPDHDEASDARHNLFGTNAGVIEKRSTDFLETVGEMQFDFIFVDGDHKNVRLDLPFFKHLRIGGLMLFHDFSPNGTYRACPPVYRALLEFKEELGRDFDVLVVDDQGVGMAGFIKRAGDDLDNPTRELLARTQAYSSASFETLTGLYELAQKHSATQGAIVECGAQDGGSAAVLALGAGADRALWLFDNFKGVPEPKPEDGDKAMQRWQDKQGSGGWAKGSAQRARGGLKKVGIKGAQIVAGDFAETFAKPQDVGAIAILHVDATLFDSTQAALERFYDLVVPGGIVIISAYLHWRGVQDAVLNFFTKRALAGGSTTPPKMHTLEKAVWWEK